MPHNPAVKWDCAKARSPLLLRYALLEIYDAALNAFVVFLILISSTY